MAERAKKPERLKTIEQADRTLGVLGACLGHKATVKAETDAAIRAAKDRAQAALIEETPDGPRPTDEYIAVLESQLEEFAAKHPEAICVDGKKSRDLTNGTLGFRASPPSLTTEQDDRELLAAVQKEVIEPLREALEQITLKCGINAALALNLDLSINKAGLLQAVAQQRVKPSELKKLGYLVAASVDRFFCKPTKQVISIEPAA